MSSSDGAPISDQNHNWIDSHINLDRHDYGPTPGGTVEEEDVSVNMVQKMLSAVSGSVLTSLLGTYTQ